MYVQGSQSSEGDSDKEKSQEGSSIDTQESGQISSITDLEILSCSNAQDFGQRTKKIASQGDYQSFKQIFPIFILAIFLGWEDETEIMDIHNIKNYKTLVSWDANADAIA